MKSKYSFISTASGVFLSLTVLVAEATSPETSLVSTLAPRQDSKVPASTPLQAKVIDCVGKVRWRTGPDIAWKDAKDAAINDLLSAGAEVRTGLRSRMTLKFDNATILIDSNSNFAMPTVELVKENDGDVYRTVAQMKSGRADFQVDKVGAKNDFKVVTPSSTLAVRGTGFQVIVGAMTGTEVTGARTNAIAAIQLKYAATNQVVLMSGGGDSKSSSSSPEPATSALMSSIGALPMVGTATSAAEHEASAFMGTSHPMDQMQTLIMSATISEVVTNGGGGGAEGSNAFFPHLEESAFNTFIASENAFAFRIDTDVALGNTIFARDSAFQAVEQGNATLAIVSSLYESAGVSRAETERQRDFAIGFRDDAHQFFLATNPGDFFNASNSANSASQSGYSANAANESAAETRGYANEAFLQIPIAGFAQEQYSSALAAAFQFANDAGTAAGGATDAAAHAVAFSQAAQNFAAIIGTSQATAVSDFAIAARNQAIFEGTSAIASRDAAIEAANSAGSNGERVFFTRTAQIASQTGVLADQARVFADAALAASILAGVDAANALAVANSNGGSGQSPSPPN